MAALLPSQFLAEPKKGLQRLGWSTRLMLPQPMLDKPAGHAFSDDPPEAPGVYGLVPVRTKHRIPSVTSVGRLGKARGAQGDPCHA
jgi:hypothetical protein